MLLISVGRLGPWLTGAFNVAAALLCLHWTL